MTLQEAIQDYLTVNDNRWTINHLRICYPKVSKWAEHPIHKDGMDLLAIVIKLNDTHKWPVEKILAWMTVNDNIMKERY